MYNLAMKITFLKKALPALVLIALSCAPVIKSEYMKEGIRNPNLAAVMKDQESFKGKLCILGGIIVRTTVTNEGSLIEALLVPVDSGGYPKEVRSVSARFLALLPNESGLLDPMVYRQNKEITLAATFEGVRMGRLNNAEYAFPFFVIRQIHLWHETGLYPPYYPYGPNPYAPYTPYSPYSPYYPYSPYAPWGGYSPWLNQPLPPPPAPPYGQ